MERAYPEQLLKSQNTNSQDELLRLLKQYQSNQNTQSISSKVGVFIVVLGAFLIVVGLATLYAEDFFKH
jgi:uncharacterized membrane protein YkgB